MKVINDFADDLGTPSRNGAGEGDSVVVEIVGDHGTLGGEDESGGFGGGKTFEKVGDGFVVVDFSRPLRGSVRLSVSGVGSVRMWTSRVRAPRRMVPALSHEME